MKLSELIENNNKMESFKTFCRHDAKETETILKFLISTAKKPLKNVTDYTDTGRIVKRAPNDRVLWEMLGDISNFTYKHCGVFLSALVLKKGGKDVGNGIFDIVAENGLLVEDRLEFLFKQIAACHKAA